MKYLTMTGFTVRTASDRWTLGYEGENNSRTLQIKTTDDLTDFATVNLLIDTLDCGAMTVTTVGNFKVLSMVLTAGMLGEAGKKTCQLLMMDSEGTVIKKTNQFQMVVNASNTVDGIAPDSPTAIIITDYIDDAVNERVSNEFIEEKINDWLDDHPEATTTVQDGSITDAKLSNALKSSLVTYNEQTKSIDISMEYTENSLVYITSFIPSGISFQNTNGDNTSDATAVMSLLDFARTVEYPIMTNAVWHNGYHINNGVVEYSRKTDPSEWSSFCYYSGFSGTDIVFFDGMANPDYTANDLLAIGDTWGLTYPPVIVNSQAFDIATWITTYCTSEPLATNIQSLVNTEGARQVIAEKGDGKIYIFTFTAKANGMLRGVNYAEMQDYLLEKGVVNAMNLDGGGSTQTAINKFPITRTQDRTTVNGRLIPIALCFEI